MANTKYAAPKFPRVMVSPKRHAQLAKEAKAAGLTIAEHAEKKLAAK